MYASDLADLAEEEEPRKKRAPWGVIALVLLTGLALMRNGSGEFDVGPPQPASAAAAESRLGSGAFPGAPSPLPYSVPDRVRIPTIRVDAPVMPIGLDADGWVAAPPPEDPNLPAGSPARSLRVRRAPPSSWATSTTDRAPRCSTDSGP